MARVASTSGAVTLPRFRSSSFSCHHEQPRLVNFSSHFRMNNLRHHRVFSTNNSDSSATEEKPLPEPESGIDAAATTAETTPSAGVGLPEYPTKDLNRRTAVASMLAAVGLFVSGRLDFSGTSLKDLSAGALPFEEALSNGKPTVVEFYADWCEVCKELAPDVYKVKQQFNWYQSLATLLPMSPRQSISVQIVQDDLRRDADLLCLNNSRNYEHRITRSLPSYTVNMIDHAMTIEDVIDSRTNRFEDGENDVDKDEV